MRVEDSTPENISLETFQENVPVDVLNPSPEEQRFNILALRDVEVRKRLLQVHINQRMRIFQEILDGVCAFAHDKENLWYDLEKARVTREVFQLYQWRVFDVYQQLVAAGEDDDKSLYRRHASEEERTSDLVAHL